MNMSKETTKTITTETSAEDRRRVHWIGDYRRGGSGSMMALVDWQQQRSVDFTYFCVANSDTVRPYIPQLPAFKKPVSTKSRRIGYIFLPSHRYETAETAEISEIGFIVIQTPCHRMHLQGQLYARLPLDILSCL